MTQPASRQQTFRGTIKAVRPNGYGFIRRSRGGDLFFHASDVSPDLQFSDQLVALDVLFELGTDPRTGRERAVNIRKAK